MTPTYEQLAELHTSSEQAVPESHIDENGHMNITHYFTEGAWGAWALMRDRIMGEGYIEERGQSFFTVEHRIAYLGELRLGERYSVRSALVERRGKAVHAATFVVDEERRQVACRMEIVFVHVDMAERRSVPVPDAIAEAIDAEAAAHPWVAEAATGLSLRR